MAELDRKEDRVYGWVNLSNDENVEWGYTYLPEVIDIGAVRDKNWQPMTFLEARELVYSYRKEVRTDHE